MVMSMPQPAPLQRAYESDLPKAQPPPPVRAVNPSLNEPPFVLVRNTSCNANVTQTGYINYFGFGSNLDEKILQGRVGGTFPKRQAAYIPDYSLFFSGPASIYPKNGSKVYGALYLLTESQMQLLDRSEGVPYSYIRINVTAISNGKPIQVQAYQFASRRTFIPPSESYVGIIKRGYADLGHPQEAY